MTVITTSIGKIGFALPYEDEEAATKYMTYVAGCDRPSHQKEVPLGNLRQEIDAAEPVPVASQLSSRGYAVAQHHSDFVSEVSTEEGIESYLKETTECVPAHL